MKKVFILIAALAMTTLFAQAKAETISAEAEVVQAIQEAAQAQADASSKEDKNSTTKEEAKEDQK